MIRSRVTSLPDLELPHHTGHDAYARRGGLSAIHATTWTVRHGVVAKASPDWRHGERRDRTAPARANTPAPLWVRDEVETTSCGPGTCLCRLYKLRRW
jgi:hypothetical protein